MKKLLLLVSIVLMSASCQKILEVTDLKINPEEVTLSVGETVQIEATAYPEDGNKKIIVFVSEDKEIAEVTEEGLVTAKAVGETKIWVSSGIFIKKCKVTVVEKK